MPSAEEAAKVDEVKVAVPVLEGVAGSPSLPKAPRPAKPQTSPGLTPSAPGTSTNWLRWGVTLGALVVIVIGMVRWRAAH